MVVNDTAWGKSFEEDGVKMRIIQSSLVDPINYTEVTIANDESLSRLFSDLYLTPTYNSFSVNPDCQQKSRINSLIGGYEFITITGVSIRYPFFAGGRRGIKR